MTNGSYNNVMDFFFFSTRDFTIAELVKVMERKINK